MTAPKHRLILALVLAVILGIAGILAWQLTPTRDPILGTWSRVSSTDSGSNTFAPFVCTFQEGGLITFNLGHQAHWELIPGPVHVWDGGFRLAQDEHAFLAQPSHLRARLYQVRFSPGEDAPTYPFTLENGVLTTYHDFGEWTRYERSGHWLTRAWERLRDAIHLF